MVSQAEMEKTYIISMLENTNWLISGEQGAATILQNTLRSRVSKLGIRGVQKTQSNKRKNHQEKSFSSLPWFYRFVQAF